MPPEAGDCFCPVSVPGVFSHGAGTKTIPGFRLPLGYGCFPALKKADRGAAGRNVFALGSVTKDFRNGTQGKNISPGGGRPPNKAALNNNRYVV
ncbi:hypothetical protein C4J81_17840 [Deltaproteobacteria bacterium Smac51]|nr:hypothetical protein C4J81_17840 [Deltaproteobacteria bacterium Smac51]